MVGSIVVSEACSAVVLQVVGFSVEVYDRCTRCSKNVVDIEIDHIPQYPELVSPLEFWKITFRFRPPVANTTIFSTITLSFCVNLITYM